MQSPEARDQRPERRGASNVQRERKVISNQSSVISKPVNVNEPVPEPDFKSFDHRDHREVNQELGARSQKSGE